jgi:hypothetical protein
MASKPPPSLGSPAGVPPSGNTKYVVIALVLLGVVGALIASRSCGSGSEQVVNQPPPADAAPVATRNPDDDVPLPPPVEDAAPDPKKKVVYTVIGAQCDAKTCTGKSTAEIERALAFRASRAQRCYNTALTNDPTLKGHVTIAVRVGANGTICSANVTSNEIANPSVANCAAGQFRGQPIPAPKGGCLDVNVPINFVPR